METAKIHEIYLFLKSQEIKTYCGQVSSLYVPQARNNQINKC